MKTFQKCEHCKGLVTNSIIKKERNIQTNHLKLVTIVKKKGLSIF